MKITIEIQNEEGEVVFTAHSLTVESAVDELYRYERNAKKLDDTIL